MVSEIFIVLAHWNNSPQIDMSLWCTEEYATTANYRMQIALDKVVTWAEQWCVTINREKTTGILFTLSLSKSNLAD